MKNALTIIWHICLYVFWTQNILSNPYLSIINVLPIISQTIYCFHYRSHLVFLLLKEFQTCTKIFRQLITMLVVRIALLAEFLLTELLMYMLVYHNFWNTTIKVIMEMSQVRSVVFYRVGLRYVQNVFIWRIFIMRRTVYGCKYYSWSTALFLKMQKKPSAILSAKYK